MITGQKAQSVIEHPGSSKIPFVKDCRWVGFHISFRPMRLACVIDRMVEARSSSLGQVSCHEDLLPLLLAN
jgi:hypothetical protein